MTYQNDFTLPSALLEQIAAQGFEFVPELIRIVINAAMQAEGLEGLLVYIPLHYPKTGICGYKPTIGLYKREFFRIIISTVANG
jgi:putative transposase